VGQLRIGPPSLVIHVATEARRCLGNLEVFSLRRKILRFGGEHPQRKAEAPYSKTPA
jgi:hypothetical protein